MSRFGTANRLLMDWLEKHRLPWRYGSDEIGVDVARNQSINRYLREDVPNGRKYMLMVDADMVPIPGTEGVLSQEHELVYCGAVGREGSHGHYGMDDFGASCFKVSHQALKSMGGPPWFRMGYNDELTLKTGCECSYFHELARRAGIVPVMAGVVGHLQTCVLLPEDNQQGYRAEWPHQIEMRNNAPVTGKPVQPVKQEQEPTWAYGVTTTPGRQYLDRTLESLARGAFDTPHLFSDGDGDYSRYGLPVTVRDNVGAWSNWVLSLVELYMREPGRTYYALFQDDVICYRNLRQYLEQSSIGSDYYLNLYTAPPPRQVKLDKTGWHRSNQLGRGALGLVMTNQVVRRLLASPMLCNQLTSTGRTIPGGIDGALSSIMRSLGISEAVHHPSLVQHIGVESSLGNLPEEADSFLGEQFDALGFLRLS